MSRTLLSVISLLVLVTLPIACADGPRDNIADPTITAVLQVSEPRVDAGTVLIEWRFIGDAQSFRIARTVDEETTVLGSVPVPAGSTSDWRTGAFRDSTLFAGTEIVYGIEATLPGAVAAKGESRIRIEGTRFGTPGRDLDRLTVSLNWVDPPANAAGYEITRSVTGGPAEFLFRTDDAEVLTFEDTDIAGNTVYTYGLTTLLADGGVLKSRNVKAGLFTLATSTFAIAGTRRVLFSQGGSGDVYLLTLTEAGAISVVYNALPSYTNFDEKPSPVTLANGDPQSLSVFPALDAGRNILQFSYYTASSDPAGNSTTLARYRVQYSEDPTGRNVTSDVSHETARESLLTLPGADSRTGMLTLNGMVLLQVGTTQRILDAELVVLQETVAGTESPVDLGVVDGAVWLAYPDRFLRSNTIAGLMDITSWSEIVPSEAMTVTAFAPFQDRMVVLDGEQGRLHLMDSNGMVILTWEAAGADLTKGDVVWGADRLWQTDGADGLHVYEPGGPGSIGPYGPGGMGPTPSAL